VSLTLIPWDTRGPYTVAFSTRAGGISAGAFESLNLGLRTHDEPENVDENRRRLCAAIGAEVAPLAMNRQRHSPVVNRAEAGERGRDGDGLWTEEQGVPMLALAADCLPIALVRRDGSRPALALLHAGRVGLLAGIVEAGVAALGGPVAAAVGPGIGPCCYEVGDDIRAAYRARFGSGALRGRNIDLWFAAERVLHDAGVESIERLDMCSVCDPERFFSHRRDGPITGRQGVIGYVA
jgi:YfiH family protein